MRTHPVSHPIGTFTDLQLIDGEFDEFDDALETSLHADFEDSWDDEALLALM
ncbi:MAG: hypothetical protein K2Q01_05505 [Rickettsiales bacterium]|nr:hypothetical protein [Rickettsiales bacterium]